VSIASPGRDTTARWPYALEFRGTAGDADGTIAKHRWDFGDGNVATVEDPGPYAYAAMGTYTVTYQATDDDGAVSVPAAVVVTVVAAGLAPEPGKWFGVYESLGLGFEVNAQGTGITKISFVPFNWQCGGDTLNERLAASDPSGWPIVGSTFTITAAFPASSLAMMVEGTFNSNMTASGTWTAVYSGTSCSGAWQTSRQPPNIGVFMRPDFSRVVGLVGFWWMPGRQVTLEIDNGGNGTVDFVATARAGYDGAARFDVGGSLPFTVGEGDLVRMRDAVMAVGYLVLYVTLESVDVAADLVSGRARQGTEVRVWIWNPLPQIEGPEVVAVADATGRWSASFAGTFDIVAGTSFNVKAQCGVAGGPNCGGSTGFDWPQ
jgi:PKD repeat protein